MKKLLTVVLALLCLFSLASCGNKETVPDNADNTSAYEPKPEPTEEVKPEPTEEVKPEITEEANPEVTEEPNQELPDICIKTPYCDLFVPNSFEGNVKCEVLSQEPYVLAFMAADDDTQLFSLAFDSETDNLLGTLELDDRNVVVYASFGDFDSAHENYETYCAYQAGINTILAHFASDYGFVYGEIVAYEDSSTFDIQTAVVTIKYPSKWKEKVNVSVSEEAVKFESMGVKLFDLYFIEYNGYLLGTYNDTPIYIVDYPIEAGNISESELQELYAMQNDVNVILQYLLEDGNFEISR